MSASIGAAVFPHEGDNIDQLIELADQRMYAVKKRHHNQDQASPHERCGR